jgi:hypothetical protein
MFCGLNEELPEPDELGVTVGVGVGVGDSATST